MTYTMGSLFSGIGGFEIAFERAGFKTIWEVEIDPFCRKILAKHFPDSERFEDVRECGRHNLRPVDIICGGFPCQDISVAGNGAGIEGKRSGLWKEMHRIIGELRPKYVVVENVPALLGRGMGVVLGDLTEIGYDAEWEIISARQVGALHLRERVWIVAYPNEDGQYEPRTISDSTPDEEWNAQTHRQVWITEHDSVRPDGQSYFPADDGKERVQRVFTEEIPRFEAFSWGQDVRRLEDLRGRSDLPEPLFRGTCDGISNWAHRIGALGNAVVPQIPEWIAVRIKKELEQVTT